MSGIILLPEYIENNQDYMFCANVKDDTIIQGLEAEGGSLSPVYAEVVLSETLDGDIPHPYNQAFLNSDKIYDFDTNQEIQSVKSYFEERGINKNLPLSTYNDMFTSSLLRSLRRGEEYKYGIVYYDKYGRRSDVCSLGAKEIEDIELNGKTSRMPFRIKNSKLIAQPVGMKITLPQPKINNEIVKDIIGCQIVRRSSSEIY
jgi:hypothetical protein